MKSTLFVVLSLLIGLSVGFRLGNKYEVQPKTAGSGTVGGTATGIKITERGYIYSYDIPVSLNIRGERWYLTAADFSDPSNIRPNGRMAAYTSCEERTIRYDVTGQDTTQLRDDLWHEVFHAARCDMKDDSKANWHESTKDSPEHNQVYEDGMFMATFIHDNPDFMYWAENWN